MTDYKLLKAQLEALTGTERNPIPNLANASALIFHTLSGLNWVGFYLMDKEELLLGPFQGNTACIRIPKGRGVCGTAVAEDRIYRVENVHEFEGHIACDSASNSEIVIPIHSDGRIVGVLDIDSPLIGRFDEEDERGLLELVKVLEKNCIWK
nr:GAF domain-containing protein [uncultured Sellimonas sp.]